MNPAEFFFLAVGLLLGVAVGAAVLDVVRARPPRPEVRLTITHDALPRRDGALRADEPVAGDPVAPVAPGAPVAAVAAGPSGASGAPGLAAVPSPPLGRGLPLSGPPPPVPPLTVQVPVAAAPAARTSAPIASGASGRSSAPVPVAVGRGLDPTLAALRAVARERKDEPASTITTSRIRRPFEAVMGGATKAVGPSAGADATAPGGSATVVVARQGPDEPGPASASASASASGPTTGRLESPGAAGEATEARLTTDHNPGGGGARTGTSRGGANTASSGSGGGTAGRNGGGGPCVAERLLADERCAVASQARERAEEVAAELRRAQRAYDEVTARADAAGKTSDPRAVADAKEAARQRFRSASGAARARGDLEAAATEWLTEINRINHDRREASEVAAQARQAAADLLGSIERLTLAADASRITAEAASSACLEARQMLADCEEAAAAPRPVAASPAAAAAPAAPPAPARRAPTRASQALLEALQQSSSLDDGAEDHEPGLPTAPAYRDGSHEPAVFRLLQGDRQTLIGLVDALAGSDREERQRTQLLLSEMVEAIVAGAIEGCVLDFPTEHPFWADFNRGQCRDIAVALASLGYRFDGLGGFADDHSPNQRDLSLAVGYAGLDPMRIRRWPDEAQMHDLYREVRVAADEYLASRAPDLTLGEMVSLLGRRSEPLADLWNAWGRARPLLLATTR